MLHTETVEAGTLALIKRLSQDAALNNFVLAGGTALSLQLGHRKSIDLDFFSTRPFDARATARYLAARHQASGIAATTNTLISTIDDVKTSFVAHQYPQVDRVNESDGLRLASLEDIGAMKLNAIVNNGRRLKDYVDMHFLLREKNLDQLLNAYTAKYSDASPDIAKKSIALP
jgi:predicted nucleotidyltransferase component of viral defense system